MTNELTIPPTGAAILAGGSSSRMGTNKALLRLQPGGPTLIETVAQRLKEAGLGDGLLLVGNDPEVYGFLGLPVVADEIAGAGPLGGVLTALMYSPFERLLVVACDMPQLDPALLAYIAHLPDNADVFIPRWTGDDGRPRLETLCAAYSQRCIAPIQKKIAAGNLAVHGLLENVSVYYIAEAELRAFDPDLRTFRNINTPADATG